MASKIRHPAGAAMFQIRVLMLLSPTLRLRLLGRGGSHLVESGLLLIGVHQMLARHRIVGVVICRLFGVANVSVDVAHALLVGGASRGRAVSQFGQQSFIVADEEVL